MILYASPFVRKASVKIKARLASMILDAASVLWVNTAPAPFKFLAENINQGKEKPNYLQEVLLLHMANVHVTMSKQSADFWMNFTLFW